MGRNPHKHQDLRFFRAAPADKCLEPYLRLDLPLESAPQRSTPGASPATSEATLTRRHQYSPSSRTALRTRATGILPATHPRTRSRACGVRHANPRRLDYRHFVIRLIPTPDSLVWAEVPLQSVPSSCVNAEHISPTSPLGIDRRRRSAPSGPAGRACPTLTRQAVRNLRRLHSRLAGGLVTASPEQASTISRG
jgi:hypothetical protein